MNKKELNEIIEKAQTIHIRGAGITEYSRTFNRMLWALEEIRNHGIQEVFE